jgi:putative ABC transport system permease protein
LIADVNLQRAAYRPEAMAQFYPELIERIKALPGVRGITYGAVVPLGPFVERAGVYIPGRRNPNGNAHFSIDNNLVGPDYFSTMGIPIVAGRTFTRDEFQPDSRLVAIVSETMARQFWPGENALGKTVRFAAQGPDAEIVGIARDIKYYSLDEAPMPYVYRPFGQSVATPVLMIRTQSEPDLLIPSLKSILASMDPDLTWEHAMDFATLRAEVLLPTRAMLAVSSTFGLIALVITAIGLFGVISYSVNRRTAEIGVRMALGAERSDILKMVIKDGFRLTATGTFLGLLTAFGATRFLSAQLFGITATDPLTFITIAVVMFAVSLAACFVPARRATRISPTLALKWGGQS